MVELFGAITTVLAVTGVVLNNRLNRLCFIVWLFSNGISAAIHIYAGLWSLAIRDIIFSILAVEGWIKWTNARKWNLESKKEKIMTEACEKILKRLIANKITISLCYGQAGELGIFWSVDVLTKSLDSFEEPFGANSIEQAIEIAQIECEKRGWL